MSDQSRFAERVRRDLATSYRIDEALVRADLDRGGVPLPDRILGYVRDGNPSALPPIAPDLETFAFNDVTADPRIPGRLIEFNIEECVRLLNACMVARRDYCDLAKQHVDVTLRSEEFILTDLVHQKEVDAGLYKQPVEEATRLSAGLSTSLRIIGEQLSDVNVLMSSGAMSHDRIEENANHAAKLVDYQMGRVHPDAPPTQREMAQYRSALDTASWRHTRKAIESANEVTRSQLNATSEKLRYAALDETFRTLRRQISQQTAYQQLAENCRPGSPLNYDERLAFLKDVFDDALKALCRRALSLQANCESLYGVELGPIVHRKGQLLDALAKWIVNAQTVLSSKSRRERSETYTLWLGEDEEIDAGEESAMAWRFELSAKTTGNRPGIIRTVSVEHLGDSARSIELDVTPPPGATEDMPSGGISSLHFGRILRQGSGEQPTPQHLELLWNGDPYGQWKLSLPKGQAVESIKGLAVHLRLAFR